jgi:hypothetical protein
MLVRLFGARHRGGRSFGAAPEHASKIMILLYAMAAGALMFVAYLAHDFYNEQLRTRMIPLRNDQNSAAQKDDPRLSR